MILGSLITMSVLKKKNARLVTSLNIDRYIQVVTFSGQTVTGLKTMVFQGFNHQHAFRLFLVCGLTQVSQI